MREAETVEREPALEVSIAWISGLLLVGVAWLWKGWALMRMLGW